MPDSGMTWQASPIIGARDVRALAEWYRDTLGFDLDPASIFEGVPGEGAVYAVLERQGFRLHIQIRRGERPAEREEIETDVYVYVDDADALHSEVAASGVTLHRELHDEPYGLRDFCLVDPEGNRVAFGSPI